MSHCSHSHLLFNVIGNGLYKPPDETTIRDAVLGHQPVRKKLKEMVTDREPKIRLPPASTFPTPALVPGDLLVDDEGEEPQTMADFHDCRKPYLDPARKTMYVLQLPNVSEAFATRRSNGNTAEPQSVRRGAARSAKQSAPESPPVEPPVTEDVLEYLRAFYQGIPVLPLPNPSRFQYTPWSDDSAQPIPNPSLSKTKKKPLIPFALFTGTRQTRIRLRPSSDKITTTQLNLCDLLDVAIDVIPPDAYALLLLTNDDLYEDEDDDFCCGRAFGGSHVAIVSSARYDPRLDKKQYVELEHSWPNSHCRMWLARQYTRKRPVLDDQMATDVLAEGDPVSAVAAAVVAANTLPMPATAEQQAALWLGRVCKTASHELGHCVGIGHCSYYACIMQGTANIAEDSRQPPYLCPVDLAKVLYATEAREKERYRALLEFCAKWKGRDRMFAAFHAWLEVRLEQADVITTV